MLLVRAISIMLGVRDPGMVYEPTPSLVMIPARASIP